MIYSKDEIIEYVREEDVKFIRLAFCDIFGKQKNISILADELPRAFEHGIAFDASSVAGFGDEARSDLFLAPDPSTLKPMPWRPEHGKVVRMMSDIVKPDGSVFPCDTRAVLKRETEKAAGAGYRFFFGPEQEFYLFCLDENGSRTLIPYDDAGYMDIAPEDRGENVRREICLTLEQMGICPESSHHEEGPGQNEIDFRYSDPLTAADDAQTFRTVVRTVARRNGLYADFSPKPLENAPGNGFHVNVSVKSDSGCGECGGMIPGIMERIREMTLFLNPTENSYLRFGKHRAPKYISWGFENRSLLIRVPAAPEEYRRIELRSPDPASNPYLAFALIIAASVRGIEEGLPSPAPTYSNLFRAGADVTGAYDTLPLSLDAARAAARNSGFIRSVIPEEIIAGYCGD